MVMCFSTTRRFETRFFNDIMDRNLSILTIAIIEFLSDVSVENLSHVVVENLSHVIVENLSHVVVEQRRNMDK